MAFDSGLRIAEIQLPAAQAAKFWGGGLSGRFGLIQTPGKIPLLYRRWVFLPPG